MALIITAEVDQAALNGITALFNNGTLQLTNTAGGAGTELALLTFGATAFPAASLASPSSVTSNAITADTSVTAGTIAGFNMRTSGAANRISGNVATSASDLNFTDNVIPGGATSVSMPSGLTLTLNVT